MSKQTYTKQDMIDIVLAYRQEAFVNGLSITDCATWLRNRGMSDEEDKPKYNMIGRRLWTKIKNKI